VRPELDKQRFHTFGAGAVHWRGVLLGRVMRLVSTEAFWCWTWSCAAKPHKLIATQIPTYPRIYDQRQLMNPSSYRPGGRGGGGVNRGPAGFSSLGFLWGFSGFLCGFSPVSLWLFKPRETTEKARETAEKPATGERNPKLGCSLLGLKCIGTPEFRIFRSNSGIPDIPECWFSGVLVQSL
jgi:hypothetical protein